MILTQHGINALPTSGGGGGENVIGGREYRVVTMPDGKVWMAENLDYKFDGCAIGNMTQDPSIAQAAYYDEDEATYGVNGNKYGLLYNWAAVVLLNNNKATLCPGWHVPSNQEWLDLVNAVGSNSSKQLRTIADWPSGYAGTDDYGFSIPPGGYWGSKFLYIGTTAGYWTDTPNPYEDDRAYHQYVYYKNTTISARTQIKYVGYSLRLVKDSIA